MDFTAHLQKTDSAVLGHLPGSETIVYTPGVGAATTVSGVYDAAYVKVDAGNAGVSSAGPAVFLRLSALPSDPSDDEDATVTVNSTVYKVREAEPDGMGAVLLFLQEAG